YLADTASDGAVLAQCLAEGEADHRVVIGVGCSLLQVFGEDAEGVGAVEVVGVDHGEWFVDVSLGHKNRVAGTPRFGAARWDSETGGELVQFLKRVFYRQAFL